MEESLEEIINFWINGVCSCIVVFIGVILNCFAIVIIRKRFENANIFYQMLISLLCFDTLVLLTWMNLSLFLAFNIHNEITMHMFPYFSIPSTQIAISASTFMTVAIAYERYLAVKDPLKYSQHMKTPKHQEKRLIFYLFIVLVLSILINSPHFCEFEVRYVDNDIIANKTRDPCHLNTFNDTTIKNSSLTSPIICNTDLGENPDFLYYYRFWARLITTGAIPFVSLLFFNIYIYQAVKRNTNRRQRLTSSGTLATAHRPISVDFSKNHSNLFLFLVGARAI